MSTPLQLLLKNKQLYSFTVETLSTKNTIIQIENHLKNQNSILFISIEHQHLNTILNLNNIAPYVVLFFDEENKFQSATYSLNTTANLFMVQTQYKKAILLPYPIDFILQEIEKITTSPSKT